MDKTNQTEPLNESKQKDISPDLSDGDLIKVISIDKKIEGSGWDKLVKEHQHYLLKITKL